MAKHIIKLPGVLRVGPFTFKMQVNGAADCSLKDNSHAGLTVFDPRVVQVRSDLDSVQFGITMMHEFIHVASMVYLPSKLDLTELQTEQVARGVSQIMQQLGIEFQGGQRR